MRWELADDWIDEWCGDYDDANQVVERIGLGARNEIKQGAFREKCSLLSRVLRLRHCGLVYVIVKKY